MVSEVVYSILCDNFWILLSVSLLCDRIRCIKLELDLITPIKVSNAWCSVPKSLPDKFKLTRDQQFATPYAILRCPLEVSDDSVSSKFEIRQFDWERTFLICSAPFAPIFILLIWQSSFFISIEVMYWWPIS